MPKPFKQIYSQASWYFMVSATVLLMSVTYSSLANAQSEETKPLPISEHFIDLINYESLESLSHIKNNWDEDLIPMALETLLFSKFSAIREQLIELIEPSFDSEYSPDLNDWNFELWNKNISPNKEFINFKTNLYKQIDPLFETYFKDRQATAQVRLDEIRWGGVKQDGIPPLRNPEMISAGQANYLEPDNIIFGIEINGDVRAYPKRILAWHEMFIDTIGGVEIAGVYCTLCGAVIPFKTRFKDTQYAFGTSGFLYRSNKLMYDKETQSLWSTTRGKPVLGPLAGKGIELEHQSVVTTTWREWRKRHPNTKVLSLNTGHSRDYDEGVAYNEYFSTDKLLFQTPFRDNRLDNKREILALRFAAAPKQQLAIDTGFLNENPLYKNKIGQQKFVVLTDKSGANRVYDPKNTDLKSYDGKGKVIDQKNQEWVVHESWLESTQGDRLPRLPYHRAFWFGWKAAFPNTQLVK